MEGILTEIYAGKGMHAEVMQGVKQAVPSTLEQGKMDPVARKETLTNQLHVCHLQKKQLQVEHVG